MLCEKKECATDAVLVAASLSELVDGVFMRDIEGALLRAGMRSSSDRLGKALSLT